MQFIRFVTQLPQTQHDLWSNCVQTGTSKDPPCNTPSFVCAAGAPLVKSEQFLKVGHHVPYTQPTDETVRDLSHSCHLNTCFVRQASERYKRNDQPGISVLPTEKSCS